MKRILIVGNGGREHALGWNLSKEEDSKIFYIPAEKSAIEISEFIKKEKIGLTVIGSEEPLERGIVDSLNIMGILEVFGPTRQMARLEWDKFYSYDIMDKLGIPQARSVKCFYNDDLKKALKIFDQPVLKSRWLSKGKGVRVYSSQGEARRDMNSFQKDFGKEILVAERLHGREFSVFGIADGKNVLPFEIAFQDYKRAFDGDVG
ncbi:MAG: hypothetical protein AABY03_01485, partial [Nanoarchaeota archaeon]